MLLDGTTLDLAPRAVEVLEAADGPAHLKLELPAAQLEIATPPATTVGEAIGSLREGRQAVAEAANRAGGLRCACAAVHPFASMEGPLNDQGRYAALAAEYGPVSRRQLVCALQVHVAVRGPERAIAVHDALRSYLPDLAALAANGPLFGGADSGMASVRPKIAELLPRQGVPPALGTWDSYVEALGWTEDPAAWWWELRPHRLHGTLELRVPDAQTTLAEAEAVAAVAHALVGWLGERHDAGEALPVAPTWRIEENRWSAARHGLAGTMADLETGERGPTSDRVSALLDALGSTAERLGCAGGLTAARALIAAGGGAAAMRAAAGGDGHATTAWLADRFLV